MVESLAWGLWVGCGLWIVGVFGTVRTDDPVLRCFVYCTVRPLHTVGTYARLEKKAFGIFLFQVKRSKRAKNVKYPVSLSYKNAEKVKQIMLR